MNYTSIPRFIGSKEAIDSAKVVVAGIPYDGTSSFRSGSRFGPREMRSYSEEGIEEFSFYFGKGLDEFPFFDAGDMEMMVGNPEMMVRDTKETALHLMDGKRRLVGIGGEHLVTYPLFLANREVHGDFTILHLDAHADLREGYAGDELSHASVMNLCLKAGLKKLVQLGIRSGTREEYMMRRDDERIVPAHSIEAAVDAIMPGEKIYLSLDVDYFDPGFFPGTGTPEAGGASFNDYITLLRSLMDKSVKIVGADIVELSPDIDPARSSTIFAAKLLRETLITMGLCW